MLPPAPWTRANARSLSCCTPCDCVRVRACECAFVRAYASSCTGRASWLTGEEHLEPTHATQRGGAVRVLRYGITTTFASMGLAIRGATLAYQVARRFCLVFASCHTSLAAHAIAW